MICQVIFYAVEKILLISENCALLGYYAVSSGNFLPMFWDNLSVPSSGFKNPKESQYPQYRVYIGKNVGSENVSVAWCQPIGLLQSVWMEGSIVVKCSWTETLCDQRNSSLCGSDIQENTHVSDVGGRTESIRLINNNLKQSNRRGKAAQ